MRGDTVEALFERLQDTLTYEGRAEALTLERRTVRRKANGKGCVYRVPQLDSRWLQTSQAAAAFRYALGLFGDAPTLAGTTLRDREVTIRKSRACASCGNVSRIGERMLYRVTATGGELASEYRCPYDCRGSHAHGVGGV